jgi:hypothetical protein
MQMIPVELSMPLVSLNQSDPLSLVVVCTQYLLPPLV